MKTMFVKLAKRLFQKNAIVLMYHRIADVAADPWQIAVSPVNFEQHLQVLQKKFKIISISNLVSNIYNKTVEENSICLTFDDGYSDNYSKAKPILEKYNMPATFFISTGYIEKSCGFWWDDLAEIFLCTANLPTTLSITINEHAFCFNLTREPFDKQDIAINQSWAWPDEPPNYRCQIYLSVWEILQPLSNSQIQLAIDKIQSWAKFDTARRQENFPMTSVQLQEILDAPLLDAGLHTMTHPALANHSEEIQRMEIAGSIEYFAKNYSKSIHVMAYPYGNYNQHTLSVLKQLNVSAAFTTEEKKVNIESDPLSLGRFQVNNWNGQEFEKQLYRWINGQ